MIAVQGPNAREKVWRALPDSEAATAALKPFNARRRSPARFGELFIARTGYTGEDGFEIVVPAAHVADAVARVAGGRGVAVRARRARHAAARSGHEPVRPGHGRVGVAARVRPRVDRRSCERARLRRQAALAAQNAARELIGLLLVDSGGVLRAHQAVHTSLGDGEITSGTYSPTLSKSIALARLPAGVAVGDVVHVQVRDTRLAARVVKPPFVRHGKVARHVGPDRPQHPAISKGGTAMNRSERSQVHRQPRMDSRGEPTAR